MRESSAPEPRKAPARQMGFADRLVDELMPIDVEWRRVVHRFPKLALVAAFGAGVFVGRTRGRALLAAASGFAMSEATRRVERIFADPNAGRSADRDSTDPRR